MALKNIKKAIILAGGKGTRLSEYTSEIPKPMIKVGPYPIMIHIMRKLQRDGVDSFYVCGGYLIDKIRTYLLANAIEIEEVTPDKLSVKLATGILPNATVHLIDTSITSGTAMRIKAVKSYVDDGPFIITYGDGLSDVNIAKVEEQLRADKVISICAVPYTERFGLMKVEENGDVTEFREKQTSKTHFINGGYMCAKPELFDYIKDSDFDFSKDTLESGRLQGKISAYIHRGYWKAIDSKKDLDEAVKEYEERGEI